MKRALAILLLLSFETRGASSVYEISPVRDLSIAAAGLLAGGIPYLTASKNIPPGGAGDPSKVNWFDRGTIGRNSQSAVTLSDVTLGVAVAGPIAFEVFSLGLSKELFEDAVVYAQAVAVSFALVGITKHLVRRPRPRVYSGDAELSSDADGYRSFYSAHVTLGVSALCAAAVTWNLRYANGVWPWIGAGALSTAIALGRVLGGVHFPTDVLVGAVTGAAVGILIPLWHAKDGDTRSSYFIPSAGGATLLVVF